MCALCVKLNSPTCKFVGGERINLLQNKEQGRLLMDDTGGVDLQLARCMFEKAPPGNTPS